MAVGIRELQRGLERQAERVGVPTQTQSSSLRRDDVKEARLSEVAAQRLRQPRMRSSVDLHIADDDPGAALLEQAAREHLADPGDGRLNEAGCLHRDLRERHLRQGDVRQGRLGDPIRKSIAQTAEPARDPRPARDGQAEQQNGDRRVPVAAQTDAQVRQSPTEPR